METPKSINYYVTIEAVEHPVLKTPSWVWRVHHTMTKHPILQSPILSDQREAIRLAEKFTDELGIKIVRPPSPKRDFRLIQGGEDEGEGTVL